MKKFFIVVISLIMMFSIMMFSSFVVNADEPEEILNTGIYYPVRPIDYYEYWILIDRGNMLSYIGGEAPFTLQGGSITLYKSIHQPNNSRASWYIYFYNEGQWRYNESSYSNPIVFEARYHNIVVANHHVIDENDGSIYFYDNYDASPMPTPTPSDRDYTGLFGQIIEAIDGLVTGIVNGFEYLFIPSFDIGASLDNIKVKLEDKFGSVIEIYNNILNNISQIESKQFEGIKIDLSTFIVPIQQELYILEPGPVNYYAEHIRAWISGIMIFFTMIYFMKKVLQIIRGTSPL